MGASRRSVFGSCSRADVPPAPGAAVRKGKRKQPMFEFGCRRKEQRTCNARGCTELLHTPFQRRCSGYTQSRPDATRAVLDPVEGGCRRGAAAHGPESRNTDNEGFWSQCQRHNDSDNVSNCTSSTCMSLLCCTAIFLRST